MKKLLFWICFVLFFLPLFLPKKKADIPSTSTPPALVTTASLADSMPLDLIRPFGLDKVLGKKINHPNGLFSNYFVYTCDKKELLRILSLLPVPISRGIADTTYRRMDIRELEILRQKVPPAEIENANEFWAFSPDDIEAYECIKAPYRHTVLISKATNQVFHRIEPWV
jgi:hypothetical protein